MDIGIIGGADGPTSVMVTSSPDWWVYAIIAVAVIAVAVATVLFVKRKKK